MMQPIRSIIVDDEPLARERIRTLLQPHDDIRTVAECANGAEAIPAIHELRPDLLFLDVQMPEGGGFEVLAALSEPVPAVIFVTAYDRYALRAFEVHAVDYLLKPFNRERFENALAHARRELTRENSRLLTERVEALLRDLRPTPKHLERLVVRSAGRIFFVRTADVDWIEAQGNYVQLHVGEETHLIRETMSSLEAQLDPQTFLRVHRSAIVNVERIRELRPWFQSDYVIVMRDGRELTSGRGYRDSLRQFIKSHGG